MCGKADDLALSYSYIAIGGPGVLLPHAVNIDSDPVVSVSLLKKTTGRQYCECFQTYLLKHVMLPKSLPHIYSEIGISAWPFLPLGLSTGGPCAQVPHHLTSRGWLLPAVQVFTYMLPPCRTLSVCLFCTWPNTGVFLSLFFFFFF